VVEKGVTDLVTSTGLTYKIRVEAKDPASQLALLKTTIQPAGITFVRLADRSDGEKGNILVVLPRQVLRAELTIREKIGIDQQTKRTYPIQEVRVEQPALQMGGALLFSQNGRLIGSLFAALAQESQSNAQVGLQNLDKAAGQTTKKIPLETSQFGLNNRNYGPQGLVVGYTPTWEVTTKAVNGFLTPQKKAHYGVLGVFVLDNRFGGVEIQSIKPNSSEQAGLEAGDVILDISGVMIQNQIDFSRATYRMIPGTTIILKVRRKIEILTVMVTVGSEAEQFRANQQSSIEQSFSLGTR
jgi:S1-C subfamily serine protease